MIMKRLYPLSLLSCVSAFVVGPAVRIGHDTKLHMRREENSRRSFLTSTLSLTAITFTSTTVLPKSALALPGVTVAEFEKILKDSAKSISIVELSGPKNDQAVVTLIDGTQFKIIDLYESATDPRSPLKLIATCRAYKIPTKSKGLEDAVLSLTNSGSKKKKVYMNSRVRLAAEMEAEKKIRLEEDELERQAELARMQN
jgi:hypothetical protein